MYEFISRLGRPIYTDGVPMPEPDMPINRELSELASLISQIDSFNQKNSSSARMGEAFGRLLGSLIRGEETETPLAHAAEAHISASERAEQLFSMYRPTLRELGMALDANREQAKINELSFLRPDIQINEKIDHEPIARYRSEIISLSIEDADQLLYFLKKIKPAELSSLPVKSALSTIATELDGLIVRTFLMGSLSEGENPDTKLYDTTLEIASRFRELGFAKESSVISSNLGHIFDGTLREALMATAGKILPASGFMPHNWHMDSTPERYREKWDHALTVFEEIKLNPKARLISEEADNYLSDSLKAAEEYFIGQRSEENMHADTRAHASQFLEIIEEMKNRLLN